MSDSLFFPQPNSVPLLAGDGSMVVIEPNASITYYRPGSDVPVTLPLPTVHAFAAHRINSFQFLAATTQWFLSDAAGNCAIFDMTSAQPQISANFFAGPFPTATVAAATITVSTTTLINVWATASMLCAAINGQTGSISCLGISAAFAPQPDLLRAAPANPISNQTLVVVVYATVADNVALAFLQVEGANGAVRWVSAQPLVISAGSFVSQPAFITTPAGETVLALVFGDAFCFNSPNHNRNAQPATCDLVPVSIPWVLTYALGTLDTWLQVNASSMLNACGPLMMGLFLFLFLLLLLLHFFLSSFLMRVSAGMFSAGSYPAVALKAGSTPSEINVVTAQAGIPTTAGAFSVSSKDCGMGIPFDGVQQTAWAQRFS